MNVKPKPPSDQRSEKWLDRQSNFVQAIVAVGMLLCAYAILKVAQSAYQGLIAEGTTSAPPSTKAQSSLLHEATPTAEQSLDPEPSAALNAAWEDRYGSSRVRDQASGMALSRAGYPIIVVVKPTPVCTGPIRLQLAMDLQVAQRSKEVDRMADCIVLRPQTRAEWTNPNPFDNGVIELRLHPEGALPFTVYGPDRDGSENPFYSWFGTIRR